MDTRKQPSVLLKNSSEGTPWDDEVIQEVYAVRDAYAAEHENDLDRSTQISSSGKRLLC